jgi:hypothetical protein
VAFPFSASPEVATPSGWRLFDAAVRLAAETSRRVRVVSVAAERVGRTAAMCEPDEVATGGGFASASLHDVVAARPVVQRGLPVGWEVRWRARGETPLVDVICARGLDGARVVSASASASHQSSVTAPCPRDSQVTGGGFSRSGRGRIDRSLPASSGEGWSVDVAPGSRGRVEVVAICARPTAVVSNVRQTVSEVEPPALGVSTTVPCEPGEVILGGGFDKAGELVLGVNRTNVFVFDAAFAWWTEVGDPTSSGGTMTTAAVCGVRH